MTRPSEGVKALDGGCHGNIHDRTLRGLFPGADLDGDHDLHGSKATQDYAQTELCLPSLTCCGFCCATEKRLSFALLLPGAALGSASSLFQPLIGKAE